MKTTFKNVSTDTQKLRISLGVNKKMGPDEPNFPSVFKLGKTVVKADIIGDRTIGRSILYRFFI